VGDIGVF